MAWAVASARSTSEAPKGATPARLQEPRILLGHVRGIDTAVTGHYLAQLHRLLRGREGAGAQQCFTVRGAASLRTGRYWLSGSRHNIVDRFYGCPSAITS